MAARRFVPARAGRPAILIPNPFYAAYGAGARRGRLRAGLPRRPPPRAASCPISMRSTTSCSPARSRSTSPRRRTRRARSPTPNYLARIVALARRFGFLVFSDECYSEIYSTEPPAGMLEAAGARLRQRGGVPFAVEALQPAGPARRLRGRRPALPRAASRAAQCRGAAGTGAGAGGRDRRLWRRGACRREPQRSTRPKFDLADQIIGDRYGYRRPAGGFFSGSMCRSRAATRPRR